MFQLREASEMMILFQFAWEETIKRRGNQRGLALISENGDTQTIDGFVHFSFRTTPKTPLHNAPSVFLSISVSPVKCSYWILSFRWLNRSTRRSKSFWRIQRSKLARNPIYSCYTLVGLFTAETLSDVAKMKYKQSRCSNIITHRLSSELFFFFRK